MTYSGSLDIVKKILFKRLNISRITAVTAIGLAIKKSIFIKQRIIIR
jgi:hypothetical protein